MALLVLALLIGVPLIEIALFIEVGGRIGLWPTIATVILTALIGTALLRRQGMATLQRAQAEMAAQRMPVRELFDGACLLVAGVLLLTPGFLTDAIGFALLIPPLRAVAGAWVARAMMKHSTVQVRTAGFGTPPPGSSPPGTSPRGGRGPVIEGEYEDLSDPSRPDDGERQLPDSDTDADGGSRDARPGSPWRQRGG
jgi:UPF0716 protein FxsA